MGFKVVFETVQWRWSYNGKSYLVPDLWSCREGMTPKFSFHSGTLERKEARRTKQTTVPV